MRSRIRRQESEQLHLFHAARQSPTWPRLPAEVRERVVPLLARMLIEYLVDPVGGDAVREVGDE